jgi:hypothetical protein
MRRLVSALILLAALPLASCTYLDRMTGQIDDTVLPGTREDAIPGKPSFPDPADNVPIEQPGGTLQNGTGAATAGSDTTNGSDATITAKCKPEDPQCQPASGGTFSDPQ